MTDDEARLAVFQILGSDIDHAWTGDWHQTLKDTAAHWVTPTTDYQPATLTGTFQQRMFTASEEVYDRLDGANPIDVTAALMDAHHKAS
jgi:hypothetical protein